ncbi:SH3 domain-containing protein [Mesorhizobium sp. CC13]|uniref:SH3 domain-containing protein n=1 Tax=Mesorhizobium sp. CC13 TaxID=3029194 RepID=UPI00326618BA
MSGFALPKLRWLLLGAMAAGGWAMTQEVPSKSGLGERPARVASRPRTEAAPRKEVPRPQASVGAQTNPGVARPKADVEQRDAKVQPKAAQPKLAAAPRPGADRIASKPAPAPTPSQPGTPLRPPAEIKTAYIQKAPPTPAPRPQVPAPRPSVESKRARSGEPGMLFTSTRIYLRQRPEIAAPVLYPVKQGEGVRIFARDGNWALVMAAGRRGWVHVESLRSADPSAPRPEQPLVQPAKGG